MIVMCLTSNRSDIHWYICFGNFLFFLLYHYCNEYCTSRQRDYTIEIVMPHLVASEELIENPSCGRRSPFLHSYSFFREGRKIKR